MTILNQRPGVPEHRNRLFGRTAEVASIKQLLSCDGPRVDTVTGPGGVGKTRLATHVSNILAKLNVTSRTEAVTLGLRKGIISIQREDLAS